MQAASGFDERMIARSNGARWMSLRTRVDHADQRGSLFVGVCVEGGKGGLLRLPAWGVEGKKKSG
jgi:hypothetical protein